MAKSSTWSTVVIGSPRLHSRPSPHTTRSACCEPTDDIGFVLGLTTLSPAAANYDIHITTPWLNKAACRPALSDARVWHMAVPRNMTAGQWRRAYNNLLLHARIAGHVLYCLKTAATSSKPLLMPSLKLVARPPNAALILSSACSNEAPAPVNACHNV